MGCLKLKYQTETELRIVHSEKDLTSKSSSENLRRVYLFGFNGMEKDDEVKGNGNSYDFGARIYDPRIGRWLSTDRYERIFPSWSAYNFVKNSPLRYRDIDGNIQVDQDGNVIAVDRETGSMFAQNVLKKESVAGKRGRTTVTEQTAVYRQVYIFADDGTKIEAQILDRIAKTTTVTDRKGTVISTTTEDQTAAQAGIGADCNCHGYSMAKGQVWIDNEDAGELLKRDYSSTGEGNADVIMFETNDDYGGGATVLDPNGHSTKVANGTYMFDAGILSPGSSNSKEAAKGGLNVVGESFWKRNGADKQVGTNGGDTKTYEGINLNPER